MQIRKRRRSTLRFDMVLPDGKVLPMVILSKRELDALAALDGGASEVVKLVAPSGEKYRLTWIRE